LKHILDTIQQKNRLLKLIKSRFLEKYIAIKGWSFLIIAFVLDNHVKFVFYNLRKTQILRDKD
jgi:hypothetical protein